MIALSQLGKWSSSSLGHIGTFWSDDGLIPPLPRPELATWDSPMQPFQGIWKELVEYWTDWAWAGGLYRDQKISGMQYNEYLVQGRVGYQPVTGMLVK